MNRVERGLPIGEWNSVENFTVSAASGKYRPTRHQYKLTFTGDTVFTSSDFSCDNNFLSLENYDDVANGKLNDHFLIDVIGQVVDLGGIRTVQVMGKDKKNGSISSTGNELACCLWRKYAEQVEAHIEDSNDQTIICLIRFAKIVSYRGEVQISNAFDASLVSINPMLEEAIHFKEKILANGLPLALIEEKEEKYIFKQQKDDWNDCEVRSISEILIATEIKNINEKSLFYCEKCHANISNVSPKYKLYLFVKDDSASCKVMMLDLVAKSIIGNTATELWDGSYDEIEDPTILPQPIESLVGKSFCFGLSINNDNVSNGPDTFFVSEVWSGDMICKIESQTEPCSLTDTNSSTHSAGELYGVDPNNESSSEGFFTPFSKRKEQDADLQVKTSTSKKLCTKLIKMEKTKTY
ncbi:hypothetical protein N665_0598s0015 [Sinapis alba]|nr:hypothetical protein N665_0598s0015 [Sinapis alba]